MSKTWVAVTRAATAAAHTGLVPSLHHCSGYKGKCPEPYTREEILEQEFARILQSLRFDDEVLAWVVEALRQSHGDEKAFHVEAIERLRREYDQLQRRIELCGSAPSDQGGSLVKKASRRPLAPGA